MNQKELKELIEFLIEKDIAEFELERGDVKVRIKRGGEAVCLRLRMRAILPCIRSASVARGWRCRLPQLPAPPQQAAPPV